MWAQLQRRRTLRGIKPGLRISFLAMILVLAALAGISRQNALAQSSPLHPTFPLLDAQGENVLDSGAPVSTMQTCGNCHDTAFIAEHSFHADAGLSQFGAPGSVSGGDEWDVSPGLFGRWDPLTYRYLSPADDALIDLTTAAWIQSIGSRHVGGGPAMVSREGVPLTDLAGDTPTVETAIVDPLTGDLTVWDWQASGVEEMNCFLCHMPDPANDARIEQLEAGEFRWANTATLLNSGIVSRTVDGWTWNPAAFDDSGELSADFVRIQDPSNENCGQCHGVVHDSTDDPLTLNSLDGPGTWSTLTTGQIFSPQRLNESGMNLTDKADLTRVWDVHAARVVNCTDCHFSLNNPIYYQESADTRPDHLLFDARRMDIGEYLLQPLHQFAKGESVQSLVAPELSGSMRRCESCHSIDATHDWLPYKERHMETVSCESCHIPALYAPAVQQIDWTVLTADGAPRRELRGAEGDLSSVTTLIDGYAPILLQRPRVDGAPNLAPHNLISAWFWVYGAPARPVREADLQQVYLDADGYRAQVLAQLDDNGDGLLQDAELSLTDDGDVEFVAGELAALGLENPRITGEIRAYTVSHNVINGEWALKDCQACHSEDSRLAASFELASYVPGGVTPAFVGDDAVGAGSNLYADNDGRLMIRPATSLEGLYVLGHDRVSLVDWIGAGIFVGTILLVMLHGGLRVLAARRAPHGHSALEKVYMYTVYERLWHWLQTATILLLIFTGLIIHKPDIFGVFSFRYAVQVHNILAVILVINAALSVFYHLVSGEIRQYLPRPAGFFSQTIAQATFYVRGIFRGEEHPFEKDVRHKLNPLQQLTYFGILNVLLPLQIVTGILMWSVQRWPEIAGMLGGLPFLAPFHTLIAWLFATFIVLHVYLTTTGPTPMAGIKAMIFGWDDVEVHAHAAAGSAVTAAHSTTQSEARS
ncbi:MAG: cytochrome b/b6 domain-containing protein [Caldilineaceae bacterium]|nr:cytochrome b/b6 domain-containing protein [Caldilineaceae bacterium]